VNLKGYKGKVKKTSTIHCNDPERSRIPLVMQGKVRTLIDVQPANRVSFRGRADKVRENVVDFIAGPQPFHVTSIDSNLEGKVTYSLETLEDGKHYRLKLSNAVSQGEYDGFLMVHTDVAKKSEIIIRVNGSIDGEISVIPKTLLIGKHAAVQPVRSGKITVVCNSGKPFKITKLGYDSKVIDVVQEPLPNQAGFSLGITPKLENIPSGARQMTVLDIETDVASEGKQEVKIHVLNLADKQ
jgi:hypothetical protein